MDILSLLTWIGTIASLGGAAFSFWQAYRSRSAAEEALCVKKQLIDHREASELAQLYASCKKAIKSIEKYGPGSIPSTLAGISHSADANDVQEFIVLFKEQRTHFGHEKNNEADQFCDVLTPTLDSFAQSKSTKALRDNGKIILTHLCFISSSIKRKLEIKTDTV